ncbi:inovirus Gp2 family protein [Burkholderia sp. Ac-20345]|uniref:inovirus-type Gp2 protein n=1 Tax=Burkholderia sp. Ac-20345 TaxID=2703891 RepID=UPI00197B0F01|nr:inovirus-type Gp2 protein [Burkholderia sp. Ac-20345]MBN3777353.1 inovirus Gp2 family protein [Burkholderia sp. Ac-20345]
MNIEIELNGFDPHQLENEDQTIKPYQTLRFDLKGDKVESAYGLCEGGIAGDVDYITQCVKRVMRSERQLFHLVPVRANPEARPNTLSIKPSKLGECLLKCLKMDLDRVMDEYPVIGKHNRYFDVFRSAMTREIKLESGAAPLNVFARERWLCYRDQNFWLDETLTLFVESLNGIVAEIRREANSEAFRSWKKAFERQPNENKDTLWSLILACLNVNHHLSILRFDLGYAQYYCDSELSGAMAITYDDVRRHRAELRRFLKQELKKRLRPGACKGMGFAIKLEYGLDKTYHFHVIVILNGDVVAEDISITEMICDYWKNTITNSKGGAYNCNKASYKECGIGSVRYSDEKLRILEAKVVPYVTKPDFYIGMVKPEGHRSFWTSHPPKIVARRTGRKRSKAESWRIVDNSRHAK